MQNLDILIDNLDGKSAMDERTIKKEVKEYVKATKDNQRQY